MEPFEHDESGPGPNGPPNGDDDFDPVYADDLEDDEDRDDEDTVAEALEGDREPEGEEAGASQRDESRSRRRRERRPRDARADRAHDFLARVLDDMGMDVSVRRRRPRPDSSQDEINLEIVGRDVGRVIGKKGQVLSALQYLVNRVTNRPGQPRRHVVLDAEGYRYRRETTLATMARRLGEQAVKEGKIITFEPMSPRDRRVVHLALAKFPNVVTKSDGEGDERRVRIIPVRR